jgi:signal transduction histidine kinase
MPRIIRRATTTVWKTTSSTVGGRVEPARGHKGTMTVGTNQQRVDAARASRERSLEPALERQRIAADIHDLIMQDLSFALATARALADDAGDPALAGTVIAAGERALAGARQVLDGLTGQRELAIAAVEESMRLAARHVPLSFDAHGVPTDVRPDQGTLYALVHIGREAVTNAVKHADPFALDAVLDHDDGWRLRVSDGGRGFDAGVQADGFGLDSMRRHAYALGGSLRVYSSAGTGTTVEAVLP